MVGDNWESWEKMYYVIPRRPRPPVAQDGRLATFPELAGTMLVNKVRVGVIIAILSSGPGECGTVGVEESFPPPQCCCAENKQLQIPMLLDSMAATGPCRSVFLCFSCWLHTEHCFVCHVLKYTVAASYSGKHNMK